MRLTALIVYMGAGALIGVMIGRLLLIPIAAVAQIDNTLKYGVTVAFGLLGIFSAGGWWTARFGGYGPGRGVDGSAHFADERQVKDSLGGGAGLIVGRENRRGGRLLRYAGQAHLLTIAPTRSGKGVGAIIPNLLTADRSVLCFDPKGENARITARARGRFGPVYVLDPFGISGQPSAAFNPLDGLEPDSLDLAEDAALLADALVHDPPGQVGEAHWNDEAKALIAGLILHVVTVELGADRSLARVRELLTGAPKEFRDLLADMQASPAAGGLVRRAANRHLGKSEREAASVLSSPCSWCCRRIG
ncbi:MULTISPECIES: type IV secretory system conjugative DNA transfer family protein [unclassified Phenylobacterium]|uniref:type IV secretory system conjugative DNA transfer family protein n=1 Tax=unclassified Phenylobacterium TaxID=2640670 RepID=UPI00083B9596|nr:MULTISPECIES: type IV secretory system conjugative DNA transfer family protein [unclassified Phenylobacterium]